MECYRKAMDVFNREIQVLKVLVEEQSLTRAAQKMGMQQPALSKILKSLEEQFERRLFSRTASGLKPSSFTLELYRMAQETDGVWSSSMNRLLEKESRVEGSYSIGCHSILASTYLRGVFTELHNKFPQLDLRLTLGASRSITEKVVRGELQFGIVANPIKHPELVKRTIRQEQVYLYANGTISDGSVVFFNPEMIDVGQFTRGLGNYKLVPVSDYQVIIDFLHAQRNQGAILPSGLVEDLELTIVSKAFYKTDIKLIYRQDLFKSLAISEILRALRDISPPV